MCIHILYLLKMIYPSNVSYRLGTVNDLHLEFKPVLSYSKPHTYYTFIGGVIKMKCIYSLYLGH